MISDSGIFRIYEAGTLTVIGFGDEGIPNHLYHQECLEDLENIVERFGCRVLAFDLANVPFIVSGMIGLLTWLHRRGIEIRLYNASDQIRNALEMLNLGTIMHVDRVPA